MRKILFILTLTFIFLFPFNLSAVTTGELGIMPAHPDPNVRYSDTWFIFNVDKGQTKEDAVQLINNSNETVSVKVYPVDAVTTSDGAFAPLEESALREGVGAWIKVSQDIVDIPPQTKLDVPFTITIPNDADVGDHVGALILENIKRDKTQVGGAGVEIVTRLGVRVFETVPGEIVKDLKIAGFDWDITEPPSPKSNSFKDKLSFYTKKTIGLSRQINFLISMRNEGNVRLEPQASIEIKNVFGKTIGLFGPEKQTKYLINFPLGLILPQKSTKLPVIWQKNAPIIDKLSVHLKITYDETKPAEEKSLTIWIIPYTLLAVLGVVIFLIVLFYYLWKLLILQVKNKMKKHLVKAGETIEKIAKKYNTDWKKIAKINKLKPPYELKRGKKLLIPLPGLVRRYVKKTFWNKKAKIIILVLAAAIVLAATGFVVWKSQKASKNINKEGPQIQVGGPRPAEQIKAEQETRDLQRKIDLANLKAELEKYYQDNEKYPETPAPIKTYEKGSVLEKELIDKNYISKLPLDPRHPQYYYVYESKKEGHAFLLTSNLENTDDAAGKKVGDEIFYYVESEEK